MRLPAIAFGNSLPAHGGASTIICSINSSAPLLSEAFRRTTCPQAYGRNSGSYHVELDVPGVTRDNVELTFEKGTLKISTERPAPEDQRLGLVDERRYGKVTRTVSLPESIDPESIVAALAEGVLHVTVSKKPEAQPKKIEIK